MGVFFDLEKAYDTTWRYGILRTLHGYGLRGHLAVFLLNFLNLRRFCVRIGNTRSQSRIQENSVPQGSILSVTLFAVAINGITSIVRSGIPMSLYVDDFAIYYRSYNLEHIERQLQLTITSLADWALQTGFQFSATKTKCIHFHRLRGVHPPPDLRLRGTLLPFAPHLKFLGLHLDSKLTWEHHIRHLRASCDRSLRVLRVLSGVSWGGDRTVMLRLYRALVRSKLDYGCFIYGAASASKLRLLDTVHHTGIRLATGAFRTSRVECLYADSGEPPLSVRRSLLLCSYAARLAAHPGHPSFISVLRPDLAHRYLRNTTISRPSGIRFRELLATHALRMPVVERHSIGRVPPWQLQRAQFNLELSAHSKEATAHSMYRQLFAELLGRYRAYAPVFTDGSQVGGATGCCFVLNGAAHKYHIPDGGSVFTAELYAIFYFLLFISRSAPAHFIICCDSLSALQALQQFLGSSVLIVKIQTLVSQLLCRGYQFVFSWTPGHVGIPGNEEADVGAKSACRLPVLCTRSLPCLDVQRYLRRHILSVWKLSWENYTGTQLRLIKDSVEPWLTSNRDSRRAEVIVTRLRIGHTRTFCVVIRRLSVLRAPLPSP